MAAIENLTQLTDFGRTRLSKNFFMRDFLYSEIAALHQLRNIPSDPELAIRAGTKLCEELLEPLHEVFGHIAIRSGYRSPEANALGSRMQRSGHPDYNCASDNAAHHIWDALDKNGCMGATACVVIPWFWDRFQHPGDWQKLAWWIHDHLPYGSLCFYRHYWAFNIQWHQEPTRSIYSYVGPKGCLTKEGMGGHADAHPMEWKEIQQALEGAGAQRSSHTGRATLMR